MSEFFFRRQKILDKIESLKECSRMYASFSTTPVDPNFKFPEQFEGFIGHPVYDAHLEVELNKRRGQIEFLERKLVRMENMYRKELFDGRSE